MSESNRFLDELNERVIVGDGAVGTELLTRGATAGTGIERLNLIAPDIVLNLHHDYIAAGSRVIETNTFNASAPALARFGAEKDCRDVILAGVRLAQKAAENSDIYIAGSVGPLPPVEGERLTLSNQISVFQSVVNTLLEGGVDLLLFETFTDLEELTAAVYYARSVTDKPIVAQMAFEKGGITSSGDTAEIFVKRISEAGADVAGANCGGGVPPIVDAITRMRNFPIPLSAYLNAGFSEEIEGRKVYLATPKYLAKRAGQLMDIGVRLIGGCCGTGPDIIRAIADEAAKRSKTAAPVISVSESPRTESSQPMKFFSTKKPQVPSGILVELDPPQDIEPAELIGAARKLKLSGIKHVTIADNPLASACADVITIAGMVMRETGLNVIPHLTGRDRNRIALQSTIMGAHIQGIRTMLCVTGDPVRMYNETNTSGVFDLVSISLVNLLSEFNAGKRTKSGGTAFTIGVALNPNVKSIDGQISKLRRKIEAGAHFALTQPLFDLRKFDIMQDAFARAGITLPVFPGILPLRSSKNADFLHNEVPGIIIPEEIRSRLARFEKVEDQRRVGTEVALELMDAFAPYVRGFYLIAPRNRVDTVIHLIDVMHLK
jgi:homocysteine S-methyltransferase